MEPDLLEVEVQQREAHSGFSSGDTQRNIASELTLVSFGRLPVLVDDP